MDEFCKIQLHRMIRSKGTGASCSAGASKSCDTGCTGARPCHASESMSSSRGEVLQHQLNRWCTGGSTSVLLWQLQGRRVAPVAQVTGHRSNRWCHVSWQRPNGYPMAQSDRMHRCHAFGYTGACAESWVTALNGYFDMEAYIYATPRPFGVCWSSRKSQTHPRTSPSHPRA